MIVDYKIGQQEMTTLRCSFLFICLFFLSEYLVSHIIRWSRHSNIFFFDHFLMLPPFDLVEEQKLIEARDKLDARMA